VSPRNFTDLTAARRAKPCIDARALIAARKAAKLNQTALGLAIGLLPDRAQVFVSRLETGRHIQCRRLADLARVLGVEIESLLTTVGKLEARS